jgi:hypothetical protein
LRRAWGYGLNFYLHRELPELTDLSEPATVIVSPEKLHDLEQRVIVEGVNSDLWPQAQIVRVKPLVSHSPGSGQPQ